MRGVVADQQSFAQAGDGFDVVFANTGHQPIHGLTVASSLVALLRARNLQ